MWNLHCVKDALSQLAFRAYGIRHTCQVMMILHSWELLPVASVRKWANHPNVHIALSGELSQDTSYVLKVTRFSLNLLSTSRWKC